MPDAETLKDDLALITDFATRGGAIAMDYFGDDPKVWMKEGQSPVSEADFAVDTFLKRELLAARPDYGWLSEETADDEDGRIGHDRTFVVDPIDGTRGFLAGSRQWCVSIGIVEAGRPVAGVLFCPALDETYTATPGGGAWLNGRQLACAPPPAMLRVTGPRGLQTAMRDTLDGKAERMPYVPSLAYRIAMVAAGRVDLGLARSGPKDWDLAAADLILHEAGGRLTDLDGNVPIYNRRQTSHPHLIASAASHHQEMLVLAAPHMG